MLLVMAGVFCVDFVWLGGWLFVVVTMATNCRNWFHVPDGKHTRLPCGRVQNLSEKLFDDFIVDALQGNMPGTYMYTRPRNTPNKGALRNSFNERAKDGFRYWLIDRPKPTSCEYHTSIFFHQGKSRAVINPPCSLAKAFQGPDNI